MPNRPITERFLEALDVSVTELAALRGVSRQYATRDLSKFLESADGLNALCRTLLVIDTDSSRAMADRLRQFATEHLNISLTVGSAVSVAGSKTYAQVFADSKELWIWAASPPDVESAEYWEKLCTEFLNKQGRLLVYFVPTLEVADRLAYRFEQTLYARQYDEDDRPRPNAEGFGATAFIIVTNLATTMPYLILANPGSANLATEITTPSCWVMGKQAQDLFEAPIQFAKKLTQMAGDSRLGGAKIIENFFPVGQPLNDSGIPFRNYHSIDQLIGIRAEHSVGLFDGEPTNKQGASSSHETDGTKFTQHPLKFYPVFIRAYRKKAGDLSKIKPPPPGKKIFFQF